MRIGNGHPLRSLLPRNEQKGSRLSDTKCNHEVEKLSLAGKSALSPSRHLPGILRLHTRTLPLAHAFEELARECAE